MPIYEFERESGERFDLYFPLGAAPSLGQWIEHEGSPARRVIAMPQIADSKGQVGGAVISEAAPPLATIEYQEKEARFLGKPPPVRADGYDEKGRACFKSVARMQEYAARDGRFVVGNPSEVTQETRKRERERIEGRTKIQKAIQKELSAPEVL